MISQLDIGNFGSFSGLNWKKSFRDSGSNVQNFKRLNIIYGRNYSGKTTLSRIFRALETARMPVNYSDPSFTVYGDKGEIHQTGLTAHGYDIRVYNRDFVTDNLSFLTNHIGGEIKTFAIVGEKNKEIEDAIAAIEANLGNVESKTGLRFDLEAKRKERDRSKDNHRKAVSLLENTLRDQAKFLKEQKNYVPAVYNIRHIESDIAKTKLPDFKDLTSDEAAAKIALLKQEVLPDISGSINVSLKADSIKPVADDLLTRTITPTQAIQELLNDSVLQLWVKQGIPLHKEKRDTCAFCHQGLPYDIWKILDSHFSQESVDLEAEIDALLSSINSEIRAIAGFVMLAGDKFYAEERVSFEAHKKALDGELNLYKQDLESLKTALESRKNNLFNIIDVPEFKHDPKAIESCITAILSLINKSNGRSKTLEKDKTAAKITLRLSDVAAFAKTINYDAELTHIASLKTAADQTNTAFSDAEKEILKLEGEVVTLREKQKDERKGADRVNTLLNHFFGHDGIKLEAKDTPDKTAVKFEITRDGKSAYNLSEGECSLIAFCYFIARLEEPGSKGKDLIIYIDDPISSLDSNHIFFIFSLIESLIAMPVKDQDGSNSYRYKQLFISTHNLDFLKYLKRISKPKKEKREDCEYLMVERNGEFSRLSIMPSYLKNYITEFNYLFHQIYKCRDPELSKIDHQPFYSFGNNLRKFLEAYLFYRYPNHESGLNRITKFFEGDQISVALTNRLDNELCHLEEVFDRSMKPLEVPEISTLSNYVLNKLFETDKDQYNALLKSIGEPERTQ